MRLGRPLVIEGYGSWISIKNLPLDYWNRKTFEAIGAYFRGLEDIAMETLNLLNCSVAKIQVKKNLCGFMPSTIEIIDVNRTNIFLNFGDIEALEAPKISNGELLIKNFYNLFDLVRLRKVFFRWRLGIQFW